MTSVLVTGASGFVGRALMPDLSAAGLNPVAALRQPSMEPGFRNARIVGAIGPETDWAPALEGIDAIVHLAGPAHGRDEGTAAADARHWRVTTAGMHRLAHAAIKAGVKRFVFVSTVKAAGERTDDGSVPGAPWRESDPARPESGYGRAKLAAERALIEAARSGAMETVILRPPLVHGPGAKGNVATLLKLLKTGLPLPLAAASNRRSVIALGSLNDAIRLALTHPGARGETFYLKDGDLSTPDIIRSLARGAGLPARLVSVPPGFLRCAARFLGQDENAGRLLDSLAVSDDKIRHALGWAPRRDVADALAATGAWFKNHG